MQVCGISYAAAGESSWIYENLLRIVSVNGNQLERIARRYRRFLSLLICGRLRGLVLASAVMDKLHVFNRDIHQFFGILYAVRGRGQRFQASIDQQRCKAVNVRPRGSHCNSLRRIGPAKSRGFSR